MALSPLESSVVKAAAFARTKGLQEQRRRSDGKTQLNASDEKSSGLELNGKFRQCILAVFNLDSVIINGASLFY